MAVNCDCNDENLQPPLLSWRTRMLIRLGYAAQKDNPPAAMAVLCDTFLQDAQEDMHMRYPALRTRRYFTWTLEAGERFYGLRENENNTSSSTVIISVADPAVLTWPAAHGLSTGARVKLATTGRLPLGLTAGKLYYVQAVPSATTASLADTYDGAALATTVAGQGTHHAVIQGFNDLDGGTCSFDLNPYMDIESVHVVDESGAWHPLTQGIPAAFNQTAADQTIPTHFEIRQCIELWPAPADDLVLQVKGHFGLRPFVDVADQPTIDGHLVYLWALANAKAHYNAPDATKIAAMADTRLKLLTAGTHGTQRYIPGVAPARTPPRPYLVGGFNNP